MDSRKLLIAICSLLAIILVIVCAVVVSQQGPSRARGKGSSANAKQVLDGAADLSGAGLLDRALGAYVDRAAGPGGASQPQADHGARDGTKPASGAGTEAEAGTQAQPGAGQAAEVPDEDEKDRLLLIRLQDRAQGERKMYGSGSSAQASRTARQVRSNAEGEQGHPEDENEVLSKFQSFLDKLHQRAASKHSDEGGRGAAAQDQGNGPGGRVQIMTVDGFKGPKPPTLQLLENVNRDGADSLMMTDNPELEDGSKDKHGKKFDGNLTTYETIPIDEVQGAFNGKEIRMSQAESVNTDGAPADLKH